MVSKDDKQHDSRGRHREPADPQRERGNASRAAQEPRDDDGPLDSLGRAVSDAVTGSMPEEIPGASNPEPAPSKRR